MDAPPTTKKNAWALVAFGPAGLTANDSAHDDGSAGAPVVVITVVGVAVAVGLPARKEQVVPARLHLCQVGHGRPHAQVIALLQPASARGGRLAHERHVLRGCRGTAAADGKGGRSRGKEGEGWVQGGKGGGYGTRHCRAPA